MMFYYLISTRCQYNGYWSAFTAFGEFLLLRGVTLFIWSFMYNIHLRSYGENSVIDSNYQMKTQSILSHLICRLREPK